MYLMFTILPARTRQNMVKALPTKLMHLTGKGKRGNGGKPVEPVKLPRRMQVYLEDASGVCVQPKYGNEALMNCLCFSAWG